MLYWVLINNNWPHKDNDYCDYENNNGNSIGESNNNNNNNMKQEYSTSTIEMKMILILFNRYYVCLSLSVNLCNVML